MPTDCQLKSLCRRFYSTRIVWSRHYDFAAASHHFFIDFNGETKASCQILNTSGLFYHNTWKRFEKMMPLLSNKLQPLGSWDGTFGLFLKECVHSNIIATHLKKKLTYSKNTLKICNFLKSINTLTISFGFSLQHSQTFNLYYFYTYNTVLDNFAGAKVAFLKFLKKSKMPYDRPF